jgi:hypothetical protein
MARNNVGGCLVSDELYFTWEKEGAAREAGDCWVYVESNDHRDFRTIKAAAILTLGDSYHTTTIALSHVHAITAVLARLSQHICYTSRLQMPILHL